MYRNAATSSGWGAFSSSSVESSFLGTYAQGPPRAGIGEGSAKSLFEDQVYEEVVCKPIVVASCIELKLAELQTSHRTVDNHATAIRVMLGIPDAVRLLQPSGLCLERLGEIRAMAIANIGTCGKDAFCDEVRVESQLHC